MTPSGPPTDERPLSGSTGSAVIRGVLLIVAAVFVGVVLLNATDEPASTVATGGTTTSTTVRTTTTETTEATDTTVTTEATDATDTTGAEDEGAGGEGEGEGEGTGTTTSTTTGGGSAARAPEEVTVLVANGSGVTGAAADVTGTVGGAGYDTASPSNLRGNGRVDSSVVFYAEGFEADARALASTLTPRPSVEPMPEPPPVSDLRGAGVVLVVGPDLAGD